MERIIAYIIALVSIIVPLADRTLLFPQPPGFTQDARIWTEDFLEAAAAQPEGLYAQTTFERSGGAGSYTHFYEAMYPQQQAQLRAYTVPDSETMRFLYLHAYVPADESQREAAQADFLALAALCIDTMQPVMDESVRSSYTIALTEAYSGGKAAHLVQNGLQYIAAISPFYDGQRTFSLMIMPEPDPRMDGLSMSYAAWQTVLYDTMLARDATFTTWNDPAIDGLGGGETVLLVNVIPMTMLHVGTRVASAYPHMMQSFYLDVSLYETLEGALTRLEDAADLLGTLARRVDPSISDEAIAQLYLAAQDYVLAAGEDGPQAEALALVSTEVGPEVVLRVEAEASEPRDEDQEVAVSVRFWVELP